MERSSKIHSNQDVLVPNQLRQLHPLPALKENQTLQTPRQICHIFCDFWTFGSCADLRVRAENGVLLP
jgi:hypothetical protein